MVIALAFCKRFLPRWLPMNQAHGPIVAQVLEDLFVSTKTTFARPRLSEG
jgi:hypothetical protein